MFKSPEGVPGSGKLDGVLPSAPAPPPAAAVAAVALSTLFK